MKKMKINGPVIALLFPGNIKPFAAKKSYVAATWLDDGNTRVIIRIKSDPTRCFNRLESEGFPPPLEAQFAPGGCDIHDHANAPLQ